MADFIFGTAFITAAAVFFAFFLYEEKRNLSWPLVVAALVTIVLVVTWTATFVAKSSVEKQLILQGCYEVKAAKLEPVYPCTITEPIF